jgi:8-hydroxy-5-deazaflavin:NADPH oxidoreductase
MKKKRIGILGSGIAGKTLAQGFHKIGQDVRLGTRKPELLLDWKRTIDTDIEVVTPAEMASWCEVLVVSVLGLAMEDALRGAGIENLVGKIVIDASDPLDFSDGQPGLFVGTTDSLGERVQRLLPNSFVVKALNIVAAEVMVNPALTGGQPDMFIAGDSDEAKEIVCDFLQQWGWSVIDMGGIRSARWLEALSLAWVVHSHRTGATKHAFALLRPPE